MAKLKITVKIVRKSTGNLGHRLIATKAQNLNRAANFLARELRKAVPVPASGDYPPGVCYYDQMQREREQQKQEQQKQEQEEQEQEEQKKQEQKQGGEVGKVGEVGEENGGDEKNRDDKESQIQKTATPILGGQDSNRKQGMRLIQRAATGMVSMPKSTADLNRRSMFDDQRPWHRIAIDRVKDELVRLAVGK